MSTAVLSIRTGFSAHRHGYAFPNAFVPGRPVMQIPTPWGTIPVGDLSKGLCGGMVFTALDSYFRNKPLPHDSDDPAVIHRIVRRLWQSFNGPTGALRIYSWTVRPERTGWRTSVQKLTAEQEWPELVQRMKVDAKPVPLMLIRTRSWNPFELGHNHQVLATGLDLYSDGRAVIQLYDPNYPRGSESDPTVTVSFPSRNFEGQLAEHSLDGPSVRGFFINQYRPRQPRW